MSKYELDRLGWYEFERLCQTLLLAELGLGVEAWGGRSDWGRDAYCPSSLHFPDKNVATAGPFVFQVKFVAAANATNSNYRPSIVRAVKEEIKRIEKRCLVGQWETPEHYVLLTNCPVTSVLRDELKSIFQKALPDSVIHVRGSSDICNLLDVHSSIRLSFPQILGLADLRHLLSGVVNKAILERSSVTIEEAEELSKVFVPTTTYYEALEILKKFGFIVLDGPPEMGKTSIAKMIALGFLNHSWCVIDCRDPNDFFNSYDKSHKQIFVADDAFGRTEFDIELGRRWERDLPRVLARLDSRHRMIWTTRRYILERALDSMDLNDSARNFPEPGEVIVSTENILPIDKARILYRHATKSTVSDQVKDLVKKHGNSIVSEQHFTPERIRRLVSEDLPRLLNKDDLPTISSIHMQSLVLEGIRNPTNSMRTTYRFLSEGHKWILISMLEIEGRWAQSIFSVYRRYEETISQALFNRALEDLIGSFIVYSRGARIRERVSWIHPSYRDLVIEELVINHDVQLRFIRKASVNGLAMILSQIEQRSFSEDNFLSSEILRTDFTKRCFTILSESDSHGKSNLLEAIRYAKLRIESSSYKRFFNTLYTDLMNALFAELCLSRSEIYHFLFRELLLSKVEGIAYEKLPLSETLKGYLENLRFVFDQDPPDVSLIEDVISVVEVIEEFSSDLLQCEEVVSKFNLKIEFLLENIFTYTEGIDADYIVDDAEEVFETLETICDLLVILIEGPGLSLLSSEMLKSRLATTYEGLVVFIEELREQIESAKEEREARYEEERDLEAHWHYNQMKESSVGDEAVAQDMQNLDSSHMEDEGVICPPTVDDVLSDL